MDCTECHMDSAQKIQGVGNDELRDIEGRMAQICIQLEFQKK